MRVKITTIIAVGAAMLWNNPALADNVAMSGVIETAAVTSAPAASNSEFQELFASWEQLEQGGRVTASGHVAAAIETVVSVPSRMPVDGVQLTSGFGMRNHPILRRRAAHNGVDLAAAQGTPVYATADGQIGMAQYYGSYGNYVQIEHGGELQTRYAHLSSYTVSEGDAVRKGDLIGYIGSTGRSTGPHLHYEVRVAGLAVDPRPYMVTQLALTDEEGAARGGPE